MAKGGMHGEGEHAWQRGGMHGKEGGMRGKGECAWYARPVIVRAVCILMECILVFFAATNGLHWIQCVHTAAAAATVPQVNGFRTHFVRLQQ